MWLYRMIFIKLLGACKTYIYIFFKLDFYKWQDKATGTRVHSVIFVIFIKIKYFPF